MLTLLLVNTILLIFSFYAIAKVIDIHFVPTLEIIAKKLKLSSDIAGATFMAIGSSAPELFISILALYRVTSEQSIGAGTIVGSAIFNVLVIVGASAMFKSAKLTWQPVIRDLVFYSLSILLLLFIFSDGKVTVGDSMIMIAFYSIYLSSFYFWKKLFPYKIDESEHEIDEEVDQNSIISKILNVFFFKLDAKNNSYIFNFLISISFIGALSYIMVESAVHIANTFNIPTAIIGLTILAAGTSIPDLLASIHVAKKGKGDMAISNAIGSNIFDIGIGLGLPWLFITQVRHKSIQIDTHNLYSSIFLLFATVVALLFMLIIRRWKIGRFAGLILIFIYIGYLSYQAFLL